MSRYSAHPALAADLVRHLTGPAEQKRRAVRGGYNPTLEALYHDPALLRANPVLKVLARVLPHAVARPARQAGVKYNRFSNTLWNAVHDVLAGRAGAREALVDAKQRLERLSRGGRW